MKKYNFFKENSAGFKLHKQVCVCVCVSSGAINFICFKCSTPGWSNSFSAGGHSDTRCQVQRLHLIILSCKKNMYYYEGNKYYVTSRRLVALTLLLAFVISPFVL